jgi:hypothetical protein
MRQALIALIATGCVLFAGHGYAQAQVAVGFKNQCEMNIIVKGTTIVNGMKRAGVNITLKKKEGTGSEANVPNGTRYYTVYDATTFRILLQNYQVPIQGRDLSLVVMPSPTNPNRLVIVAE